MSNQSPYDSGGISLIDQMLQKIMGVDHNYLNSHDRRMGAYDPSYGIPFDQWKKNKQDTNKVLDLQDNTILPKLMGMGYTLEDLGFQNQPDLGKHAFDVYGAQNDAAHAMNKTGLNYDPNYLAGLFGAQAPAQNQPAVNKGTIQPNQPLFGGQGPANGQTPLMGQVQQPATQPTNNQQQNTQSYDAQTQVQPQMSQLMGSSTPFQQKNYQRQY